MRPLNRPMFRYGGPIKEGVMSGIREPHAGGGRTIAGGHQIGTPMGNRTGFADPSSPGFWKRFLANYTPKNLTPKNLLSRIMPWKRAQAAKYVKPAAQNLQGIFVKKATSPGITGSGAGQTFMKNLKDFSFPGATKALGWAKKAKNLAFKYPKSTLVGGTYVGPKIVANVPTPKWSGSWGIKDILVPDEIYNYETGRWFNPDDKDIKPEDKKILDEKITETNPWKEKYEALVEENKVPKKSDEEIRAEKIQKYRDIVDIKGMNSEAASKSLIEASRLINESQDFKGDIRSGSLINKIIQGASKAYDKPADMRRAIDTLILKGEIEGDIAAQKGSPSWQQIEALSKASGKSHQYVANRKLEIPNTVGESVAQLKKIKGIRATSDDVATQVYSFSEQSGVPVQKHITTEQKNELIGKDKKYSSLTEMISKEKFTEDGYYIIGTSVVEVVGGVPRIKA